MAPAGKRAGTSGSPSRKKSNDSDTHPHQPKPAGKTPVFFAAFQGCFSGSKKMSSRNSFVPQVDKHEVRIETFRFFEDFENAVAPRRRYPAVDHLVTTPSATGRYNSLANNSELSLLLVSPPSAGLTQPQQAAQTAGDTARMRNSHRRRQSAGEGMGAVGGFFIGVAQGRSFERPKGSAVVRGSPAISVLAADVAWTNVEEEIREGLRPGRILKDGNQDRGQTERSVPGP